MADIWNLSSNLNRGELDPLLAGRQDLETYYSGVQKADNVLCLPQGGMKKRPGTEYLDTKTNGRLENFSFSTEQNYVLLFTDERMYIYKDGVLQTNINGSGNDYISTPYSPSEFDFDYLQSADTAIILHESIAPQVITRTSDTAWTIAAITFQNVPQYDFNDASSPTPVTEVQQITFVNAAEGDRFKLSLEGLLTDEIVFSSDDATNEANMRSELQELRNTAGIGISVTSTAPLVTYQIAFASDSANDWDLVGGTAVYTINVNFQITAVRTVTGTARAEDAWSATRGWPSCGTFHEGRLWLAGSTFLPSTLWGSRTFDFYNFYTKKGLDDESIDVTIDTDQVNAIQRIFSNRSLQIFTSGGEFFVPESPITPENIAVKPQTNLGSKKIRPVTIEGVTYFVQRTGKAIQSVVFQDEYKANQVRNVSVIASHLIKDPVELAVSRGTDNTDANYVYILNDDGTLTVFNTLSSEEVQGFTQWNTAVDGTGDGFIKSICVSDDTLYLYMRRTTDSVQKYFLERESIDYYTDSTVVDITDDDEITGLDHLEGETVWAKADGAFMGEFTVASGLITLPRTSDDKEAGLSYLPEIVTMPLNVNAQNGPNAYAKKKIARVALNLYQSNGVLVNDERISDKLIGIDQFDPPSPRTGITRMHLLGWNLEAQITVTQSTPMPLTLLSIGMEVKL